MAAFASVYRDACALETFSVRERPLYTKKEKKSQYDYTIIIKHKCCYSIAPGRLSTIVYVYTMYLYAATRFLQNFSVDL